MIICTECKEVGAVRGVIILYVVTSTFLLMFPKYSSVSKAAIAACEGREARLLRKLPLLSRKRPSSANNSHH